MTKLLDYKSVHHFKEFNIFLGTIYYKFKNFMKKKKKKYK